MTTGATTDWLDSDHLRVSVDELRRTIVRDFLWLWLPSQAVVILASAVFILVLD
jgi:hypothetical protein